MDYEVMDYGKISDTKLKLCHLNSKLEEIEQMRLETLNRINEIQSVCNHDLIFINRKYWNKAYNHLQYGNCLVCGKEITLSPNNFDLDNKEFVQTHQIIDVVDEISSQSLDDFVVQKNNIELEEAQRVFNSLTNDADYLYSRDCIKSEIVEAVKTLKGNTKKK